MNEICPLISTKANSGYQDCLEEKCAWFDETECAVKGLSSMADTLYGLLEIAKKQNIVVEEG